MYPLPASRPTSRVTGRIAVSGAAALIAALMLTSCASSAPPPTTAVGTVSATALSSGDTTGSSEAEGSTINDGTSDNSTDSQFAGGTTADGVSAQVPELAYHELTNPDSANHIPDAVLIATIEGHGPTTASLRSMPAQGGQFFLNCVPRSEYRVKAFGKHYSGTCTSVMTESAILPAPAGSSDQVTVEIPDNTSWNLSIIEADPASAPK